MSNIEFRISSHSSLQPPRHGHEHEHGTTTTHHPKPPPPSPRPSTPCLHLHITLHYVRDAIPGARSTCRLNSTRHPFAHLLMAYVRTHSGVFPAPACTPYMPASQPSCSASASRLSLLPSSPAPSLPPGLFVVPHDPDRPQYSPCLVRHPRRRHRYSSRLPPASFSNPGPLRPPFGPSFNSPRAPPCPNFISRLRPAN